MLGELLINTKRTEINVIGKVIALGFWCSTTLMTRCCNFGCETDFTAFAKDPVEKKVLIIEVVQKLKNTLRFNNGGILMFLKSLMGGYIKTDEFDFSGYKNIKNYYNSWRCKKIGTYGFDGCRKLE